ncbi:hypothetical protein ACOME3_003480 [Neoechinorhynchus agilis]
MIRITDNSSSLVFFPYMNQYPPEYLRAMFVAEGMAGLIPGILKIFQGGSSPICISNGSEIPIQAIGKIQLNQTLVEEKFSEPAFSVSTYFNVLCSSLVISLISLLVLELSPSMKTMKLKNGELLSRKTSLLGTKSAHCLPYEIRIERRFYWLLMAHTFVTSFFLWGIVASIFTYAVLPYGYSLANFVIILGKNKF